MTNTNPQRVYMARDNFVLCVGCSYTLTPIVLPGTASQSVTYESTDPDVASVDADGVVTAHSEGSVDIYIRSAGNSELFTSVIVDVSQCGSDCDDCSDTVAVSSLTLNCGTTKTVQAGATGTITATVSPSDATDTSVYWHSSNTSVLTCTSAGRYTAKAAGTAVLTACAADGVYKTVTFTVKAAPTSISVVNDNLTLTPNTTYTLTPTVLPAGASQEVTYASTKPYVATVSENGVITAQAQGTTTVKITSAVKATVYKDVTVTVCNGDDEADTIPVTGITLTCSTATTIPVGTTGTVTATVAPENATNKSVIYSSSAPTVLFCDGYGNYEAKASGTAVVTAYAADDVSATVTFTVTAASEEPDEPDEPAVSTETASDRAYRVHDDEATASHSVGPNATGMIDLRDGTLKFSVTDFAWDGYLMPVTIRHLYTSALKDKQFGGTAVNGFALRDFSAMQTGLGWRLNYMLSLTASTEEENGESITVYSFVDREGDLHKLYPTAEANVYEDRANEGVKLTVNTTDDKLYVTVGNECYYQTSNNIFRIYDTATAEKHSEQAAVDLSYTATHGYRISKILDGNDRAFTMGYAGNTLSGITAPDGKATAYTYDGELLTKITYPRGESLAFAYDASNRITSVSLLSAAGESEYRLEYAYYGDMVAQVTEYGTDDALGRKIVYAYGENITRIYTYEYDDDGVQESSAVTTYLFDQSGELLDSYTDHGGYVQVSGTEDGFGSAENGETHSYERTSQNLLMGHGFDRESSTVNDLRYWTVTPGGENCTTGIANDPKNSHDGNGCMYVATIQNEGVHTVSQTLTLPAGEYTFSAYARAMLSNDEGSSIQLRMEAADGSGAETVKVSDTANGYMRLFTSFTSAVRQDVTVKILIYGNGTFLVDSAQLEQGGAPTAYNAVKNGSFLCGTDGWSRIDGENVAVLTSPNMDALTGILKINRGTTYAAMPYQYIPIRSFKNARTTFTLSGFAKLSEALAATDENIKFRLRACITYVGDESPEWQFEDHVADFSQETDQWQYMSVSFTKDQFRTIKNIAVSCEYFTSDANAASDGTYAYFDSVALTVGETEYNLTEQDFGVYNEHEDDENTCDIEDAADSFEEIKGDYNLTVSNTTYNADAFGTIYSLQKPNEDYIGYEKEVDARGNVTTYETDKETSRVTKKTDRMGNVTEYTYDDAGNVTRIRECDAEEQNAASVEYAYDEFGELETVTRDDGMTYAYGYNEFHKLSQIKIEGKPMPLVQYGYKNRNGSLKSMRYANAHVAEYTYDRFGKPIRETWKLGTTVTQDTKYTYDGSGNPVSVLDITNEIEYTYVYENGRLLCEMQSEGAYIDENGFKHPGTLKCKTVYRYNSKGNVAEKTFYDADGSIAEKFVYTDDDHTTVILPTGAKVRSRSDKLGRLEFDEVQTGSGALSRKLDYVEGAIPTEYAEEGKVLSAPTTNLVERISYSDGDKLEYTYDAEERITSVKGKYTSAYEYDCHGQLTGEAFTDADGKINITEVTYDTAGNIRTKGGKLYEYDSTWKDLLVKYDGKNIYYDALGNPTTYLGNVLTWTVGRKLQSLGDDIAYNYNSLGQRIRKTVGDTEHEYFYEGNRLIKEVRTESDGPVHTLVFLYDASDSPVGMQYDGTAYYYKKNLQGDVIALLDANCKTIAEYVYDAWGALRTIEASAANATVAEANPIRYRGYYYDSETGFYFLQSRYYDPVVGRFLNADDTMFLGMSGTVHNYNLFAYCENEPMNFSDYKGYFSVSISSNYYTISFNDWETSMLIGAFTVAGELVAAILGVLAAIPSLGVSFAVAAAIGSLFLAMFGVFSLMNTAGGNKGLHLNLTRKWYLPNYIGINKSEPSGFNNIWEVFTYLENTIKKIVRIIGPKIVKHFADMYHTLRYRKIQIIVLFKMIYDSYCGKKVKKSYYETA